MTSVKISPAFIGSFTYHDILIAKGWISLLIPRNDLRHDGYFFAVESDDLFFTFQLAGSNLVVTRNETTSVLTTSEVPSDVGRVILCLAWDFTELDLSCTWLDPASDKNEPHVKRAKTPTGPAAPSNQLVKWARIQNLVPSFDYETEEYFRQRIYSALMDLQVKINESGAINPFWNISYQGQRIISREPKKEPDQHPTIKALLSDAMLLASIEVVPEYKTGVGNLDFMFLGIVKGVGLTKLCVEFKNAHSKDLIHGLEYQLPLYMNNTGSRYGAYCVLYFCGEWFEEPKGSTIEEINYNGPRKS